jgi:hypothetical protein
VVASSIRSRRNGFLARKYGGKYEIRDTDEIRNTEYGTIRNTGQTGLTQLFWRQDFPQRPKARSVAALSARVKLVPFPA